VQRFAGQSGLARQFRDAAAGAGDGPERLGDLARVVALERQVEIFSDGFIGCEELGCVIWICLQRHAILLRRS
jgi:hypothetical protein